MRPRDLQCLIQLGHALNNQRRADEAEQVLRHALTVSPFVSDIWLNLAYTLVAQGLHGQASEAFEVAAILGPAKAKSHALARRNFTKTINNSDFSSSDVSHRSGRSKAIWHMLSNRSRMGRDV